MLIIKRILKPVFAGRKIACFTLLLCCRSQIKNSIANLLQKIATLLGTSKHAYCGNELYND